MTWAIWLARVLMCIVGIAGALCVAYGYILGRLSSIAKDYRIAEQQAERDRLDHLRGL